mmetsp:Transcript_87732/g.263801  ORF Transcript_87732/g.263801 Transcript_87732/m.263801 type:complete len:172 (+) Transcript_87732:2-517(+)
MALMSSYLEPEPPTTDQLEPNSAARHQLLHRGTGAVHNLLMRQACCSLHNGNHTDDSTAGLRVAEARSSVDRLLDFESLCDPGRSAPRLTSELVDRNVDAVVRFIANWDKRVVDIRGVCLLPYADKLLRLGVKALSAATGALGTRFDSFDARLVSPTSRSSPPLSAIAIWL